MTFTGFGCNLACKWNKGPAAGYASCSWGEDEMCPAAGPEMFVFWSLGAFLTILATTALPSKFGRKFVLAVTNLMAKSIGIEYKMHDETLVVKPWHVPTPGVRGEPGTMSTMGKILTGIADVQAKFLALTDPVMQKDLRNGGTWKKKDTYGMFYGDYNQNGTIWALFLLLKNLLVGIMLTSCEVSMCSVPCACGIGGKD
eukprot:CAMPEP_0173119776 /NCGR_PEP_ID=MMETSP1102-20130122/52014_1 /TAXON_ID=49646 /ORGANISM="Geminigera sp., Strain Caron Lab Isolate" /LENGTH=198 /DNA_ID=CAMNT_0014025501 /DNA_START=149 /DNA_END=742 /DNA_ORIENTATION=-